MCNQTLCTIIDCNSLFATSVITYVNLIFQRLSPHIHITHYVTISHSRHANPFIPLHCNHFHSTNHTKLHDLLSFVANFSASQVLPCISLIVIFLFSHPFSVGGSGGGGVINSGVYSHTECYEMSNTAPTIIPTLDNDVSMSMTSALSSFQAV